MRLRRGSLHPSIVDAVCIAFLSRQGARLGFLGTWIVVAVEHVSATVAKLERAGWEVGVRSTTWDLVQKRLG